MGGRTGTGEEKNRELTLIFSATVSEQCLLRGKRVPQPPPASPPSPPFTAEAGRALSRGGWGGGQGKEGRLRRPPGFVRGPRQCPGPAAPGPGGTAGRHRAHERSKRGEPPALLTCFPSILQEAGERRSGCLKRSSCKETNTALALSPAGGSPPPGKRQPRLEKYRYCYERRLPGSFLRLPLPGRGAAELGPRR